MSALSELLQKKKQSLKSNSEGTLVRTKEGKVYREKVNADGSIVQEEVLATQEFVPIQAAADPEVCQIWDGVYLGSQDAAVNLAELSAKNIKYILNVATGIPNAYPQKFTYCTVEILDVDESKLSDYFGQCFDFIQKAVSNNEGVLVHCNAGVSRSASVVIGYLMGCQGMSFQNAYQLVKQRRPKIQPNRGFLEQLQQYEKTLMSDMNKA